MHNVQTASPAQGTAVRADLPYSAHSPSVQFMPAAAAFARFGPELAHLCRRADPATAMHFSPAWRQAVPPPRGYAHRLLVLHDGGCVCAAVSLRERTIFGLRTGILHGGDAKGEGLVLCPRGSETEWLEKAILGLFRSRRCIALLLQRRANAAGCAGTTSSLRSPAGLEQRSEPLPCFWQTALMPNFDAALALLGHRTRRNLRHALRRVTHNSWRFLPDLSAAQVLDATTHLARRSTHPYAAAANRGPAGTGPIASKQLFDGASNRQW